MKKYFLLILLIIGWETNQAQNFSDSVRISLVTGSPGSDLYAQFGHSAIRVQDFKYNQDLVFNYGTFDFDTPNFYWKFVRGKLEYILSVGSTSRMIPYYEREGRSLTEQEILLDSAQQQRVLEFLRFNYQPENRGYLYDFFFDNCATRIRDVFENELAPNFTYLDSDTVSITFRQLLDIYIAKSPWIDFGMDLVLGTPADQKADLRGQMYLPDFLSENLNRYARLDGKPLLGKEILMTNAATTPTTHSMLPTPSLVFSFLLATILVMTWSASSKVKLILDRVLFTIVGLAGVLMLFLWLGTDHQATKGNWNVLWASPLYMLVLPLLKQPNSIFRKILLWIIFGGSALVFFGWYFLPQQFHVACVPIILLLFARLLDRLNIFPKSK